MFQFPLRLALLAALALPAAGCKSSASRKAGGEPETRVVYRRTTGSNLTGRYEVEAAEAPRGSKKERKKKQPAAKPAQAPEDYVPRSGFR